MKIEQTSNFIKYGRLDGAACQRLKNGNNDIT